MDTSVREQIEAAIPAGYSARVTADPGGGTYVRVRDRTGASVVRLWCGDRGDGLEVHIADDGGHLVLGPLDLACVQASMCQQMGERLPGPLELDKLGVVLR